MSGLISKNPPLFSSGIFFNDNHAAHGPHGQYLKDTIDHQTPKIWLMKCWWPFMSPLYSSQPGARQTNSCTSRRLEERLWLIRKDPPLYLKGLFFESRTIWPMIKSDNLMEHSTDIIVDADQIKATQTYNTSKMVININQNLNHC